MYLGLGAGDAAQRQSTRRKKRRDVFIINQTKVSVIE